MTDEFLHCFGTGLALLPDQYNAIPNGGGERGDKAQHMIKGRSQIKAEGRFYDTR